MRIAREGLKFILPCAALALGSFFAGWGPLAVLFLLAAAAFTFFFRDPRRTPPEGESLLLSPADGLVLAIEALDSAPGIEGPVHRIAIFLSLLDVHLVRSPLAATVGKVEYKPGRFLPAYRPEAGEANESNTLILRGARAVIRLKMSVGVAARRIKCYVREGQAVAPGQKIGLMYFGSRVEISLPRDIPLKVGLRQKVKAGRSVIAEVQP
jgi:phosphatidylserine decarboxylase